METRSFQVKLYPTVAQAAKLQQALGLACWLYNTALEQRIYAYKHCGVSVSLKNQSSELKSLRDEVEPFKSLHFHILQTTLRRLDRSFQNFFRRVKNGEKSPGFPRFKNKERFKSFSLKQYGNGWKIDLEKKKLKLHNVGFVKFRGSDKYLQESSKFKTCTIKLKNGTWYAHITVEILAAADRPCGTKAIGLDWGTKTFLTAVDESENIETIENPRFLRNKLKHMKKLQKSLSRKKKGSNNRRKARRAVAKCHEKITNQRNDFLHKISAKIVSQSGLIATEKLSVKNMTSSGGQYKKGLNREILSTAPSRFFGLLKYKAEEAGIQMIEIDTRKVKPTQTCSNCGSQAPKGLGERTHSCQSCGFECDRDVNAAKVILAVALGQLPASREPAGCGGDPLGSPMKHEASPFKAGQFTVEGRDKPADDIKDREFDGCGA